MSFNSISGSSRRTDAGSTNSDDRPSTRWRKFCLIVKVVELRLRFVVLMAITGFAFAYWETIVNRYEKWMRPAAEQLAAVSETEFFCPMHPQVVQEEPGQCPICGMTLSRRPKGSKTALPEGVTARVELRPARRASRHQDSARRVCPPGANADDGRIRRIRRAANARIVSKVPGTSRVETLHVNFTGEDVDAGQPLAELYSPELNQAIQELRRGQPGGAGSRRPERSGPSAAG